MAKAKKASLKKANAKPKNQGVRIASALFVALGILVVLSMLLGSVFTNTPQVVAPVATSFATAFPTAAATAAP